MMFNPNDYPRTAVGNAVACYERLAIPLVLMNFPTLAWASDWPMRREAKREGFRNNEEGRHAVAAFPSCQ